MADQNRASSQARCTQLGCPIVRRDSSGSGNERLAIPSRPAIDSCRHRGNEGGSAWYAPSTIDRALDLVVFGERLASGTARARGRAWNDVAGEMERGAPGCRHTSSTRTCNRGHHDGRRECGAGVLSAALRCAPFLFQHSPIAHEIRRCVHGVRAGGRLSRDA